MIPFTSFNRRARGTLGLFAGLAMGLASLGAGAATLDFSLQTPDIRAGFIDVVYDADTLSLVASGYALSLDDNDLGGDDFAIDDGTFSLEATIDNDGALLGGSLTVGGTIAALNFVSGTLLTGELTMLGFQAGGADPLEFLFAVTGGDVAPDYAGRIGGVILFGTNFAGDFNASFENDPFEGNADVAPVPLPASLWLMLSSVLAAFATRRRRAA